MEVPAISRPTLRFFRGVVRRYFRRHFQAVRVVDGHLFAHPGTPLIVYANHSSWWDPMVSFLLADRLMPERRHFAPMGAVALARYGILSRIGVFPVAMNSARGAAQFLRTGEAILETGGVLWITPQGRFADPRERPLDFKPGLSALAARVATRSGSCTLLPLAIEYPFWDERLPQCLLHFGERIRIAGGDGASVAEIDAALMQGLLKTMASLEALSIARDPAAFETLAAGGRGAGGFFAILERLKALAMRRPYRPDHTAQVDPARLHVPKV